MYSLPVWFSWCRKLPTEFFYLSLVSSTEVWWFLCCGRLAEKSLISSPYAGGCRYAFSKVTGIPGKPHLAKWLPVCRNISAIGMTPSTSWSHMTSASIQRLRGMTNTAFIWYLVLHAYYKTIPGRVDGTDREWELRFSEHAIKPRTY